MFKNFLIILNLSYLFFSCQGQNKPLNNQSTIYFVANVKGDTVHELSQSISIIFQDRQHNYWFGSRNFGVFKYDGKTLLQFTTNNGLVSNDIWGIQEDKFGNIYFDTQEGVSQYDGKMFNTLKINEMQRNDWRLEKDDLWFRGNWNINGTLRFDGKNLYRLEFPHLKLADDLKANFPTMAYSPYGIYTLYVDKKGHVWFGTSNMGLFRFNGKHISNLYEDQLTFTPSGGSFGIRSIFEDSKGKYWICNTNQRFNIAPEDSTYYGNSFIRYSKEKGISDIKTKEGESVYFMSIVEDNQNNIWLLTYNDGIWRYDGKTAKHYTIKTKDRELTLFSMYKDALGKVWVCSHEGGVYYFDGNDFVKFKFRL